MNNFKDTAILVTGSTRGIGLATAKMLCAAGAQVGIHGRTLDKVQAICEKLSWAELKPIPISGDFAQPECAASSVKSFAEQAGHIDGLVNNAGAGTAAAFRSMTIEKWRHTFACNLEAAVIASREAYAIMRSQSNKRSVRGIVNVASIAAHGPGKWMSADYAASKAGLVSLTKTLAFEAARFGIRVNAVSPGFADTDMTAVLTEDMRASINIPMGRFADVNEIASVILFLLSDKSAYVTGQVLHVDGGLQMQA
ncbi:MAG: SDR family oxidoreductase [Lentisphaerae bacterium]|nr:SDR family oxidoreductase [Lentisphaerota bacterium]